MNLIRAVLSSLVIFLSMSCSVDDGRRAERAIASVKLSLEQQLQSKGLEYGAPVFIRIFKELSVLEVWLQASDGKFKKFKDYEICTFSGDLGPKLREGDRQSPEGFYFVDKGRLNPNSRFHLSFNLGFPNKYDRYHKRTGSALMVHGNCVSAGCYAMTDKYINEIYAMVSAALDSGQSFFRVHAFPFKLEATELEKHKDNKWYSFWSNLKKGYDYFEENKIPPNIEVAKGLYVIENSD